MTKLICGKILKYSLFLGIIAYDISLIFSLLSEKSDVSVLVGVSLFVLTMCAIAYFIKGEIMSYENLNEKNHKQVNKKNINRNK